MISIRPARVDDVAVICATEMEISATPGYLVAAPDELSLDSSKRMIEQLAGGVGCYLVAEEDDRIVGHAFLRPMDLRAVSHVFRLTIAVHPARWRRGIGKALMYALCKWAKQSPQVEKVELLVRSSNDAACALYSQFGFVAEGRLRNRVRFPSGAYVDDIAMAWFPKSVHA